MDYNPSLIIETMLLDKDDSEKNGEKPSVSSRPSRNALDHYQKLKDYDDDGLKGNSNRLLYLEDSAEYTPDKDCVKEMRRGAAKHCRPKLKKNKNLLLSSAARTTVLPKNDDHHDKKVMMMKKEFLVMESNDGLLPKKEETPAVTVLRMESLFSGSQLNVIAHIDQAMSGLEKKMKNNEKVTTTIDLEEVQLSFNNKEDKPDDPKQGNSSNQGLTNHEEKENEKGTSTNDTEVPVTSNEEDKQDDPKQSDSSSQQQSPKQQQQQHRPTSSSNRLESLRIKVREKEDFVRRGIKRMDSSHSLATGTDADFSSGGSELEFFSDDDGNYSWEDSDISCSDSDVNVVFREETASTFGATDGGGGGRGSGHSRRKSIGASAPIQDDRMMMMPTTGIRAGSGHGHRRKSIDAGAPRQDDMMATGIPVGSSHSCKSFGSCTPRQDDRTMITTAIPVGSGHSRKSIGARAPRQEDMMMVGALAGSGHSHKSIGSSLGSIRRQNSFRLAPGRQRSRRNLMIEEQRSSTRRLEREKKRAVKQDSCVLSQTSKVHLPTSVRQAVLESWKTLESNMEQVGVEVFLALFEKHPRIKDLFPFGGLATADLAQNKLLQAHASGFMKTFDVALAGLGDMESLLPVLRNLGRIHTLVGVQPEDYDIIYKILVDIVARHVGPDKWTIETQEAWHLSYSAIVSSMKDPSRHLDVEPAEGWGLWNAMVCVYLAIVTPLQLADFGRVWIWQWAFHFLNWVAISTFLIDYASDVIQLAVQFKSREVANRQDGNNRWFFVQFQFHRIVRRMGLSRWASWPALDVLVLSSFALQYTLDLYGWQRLVPTSLYYAIGLVRILCISRLVHFFHCAELLSLKSSDISMEQFHYAQLAQLFSALAYIIHLFGCLHCMVSRLSERGPASTFSPALQVLLTKGRMTNAYLTATYWAFVNVAGIGSYNSTPETCLEIVFCIFVHLVGATLYASAAGSIFAILEDRARAFSKVREGVASLKEFMEDCNIPAQSHEAFVSGYLMRNFINKKKQRGSGHDSDELRLLLPKSAEDLPSHLAEELTIFSRAKAIRSRGIRTASVEFSFVLAESMVEKLTLLPGDYLFQEGELVTRRVWMVDKGTLEVFINGMSKRCLFAGDVIGLGWLTTGPADSRESARYKAYLDWVSLDGMAIADVRAMDTCCLVVGLSNSSQLSDLNRLYPQDIIKINDSCK